MKTKIKIKTLQPTGTRIWNVSATPLQVAGVNVAPMRAVMVDDVTLASPSIQAELKRGDKLVTGETLPHEIRLRLQPRARLPETHVRSHG